MRKLALLLLLVCLAGIAWWTATPRTAEQAVGWCVERAQKVKFIRCVPGRSASVRGKVVGTSPQMIDIMPSEPPLGLVCPPEADYMVQSPFPSGDPWLCLDTKPGNGNMRA